jgi:NADP-dependent 3-hydroxy acid dehydrogenase YdfG
MAGRELSIVTGGNKGIGKGIALRFAKENHDLVIFGRDTEALEKTSQEIKDLGAGCDIFAGDIADEDFVDKSVAEIIKKHGKIDHLINNAGTRVFKKIVDAKLEDFKKQIDPNVFGVFNFCKSVLPNMIENKKGSIINIASLAGKNSFVTGSMYSATKHAVLGFTRSLMLEVREYNIRVAAICPGSVDTSFFDGTSMKPNKDKILKPEDVADAVMAILKLPARALISEIDLRPTNPK